MRTRLLRVAVDPVPACSAASAGTGHGEAIAPKAAVVQDPHRAGDPGHLEVAAAQAGALRAERAPMTARNRQSAAAIMLPGRIAGNRRGAPA